VDDEKNLKYSISMSGELLTSSMIQEYGPLITSLCRRMVSDEHKAKDAAQEIWYEIIKSLPSFRGEAKLSTWIYTLARRTLWRFIDDEKSFTTRFLSGFFVEQESKGMTEMDELATEDRMAWIKLQCHDCITGIIHCLDNESRLIYLMRALSPLSYQDLSRVFGKREESIRQSFSRSSRKINRFLNGHCFLYNPKGTCRCKMKAPIQAQDLEREHKKVQLLVNKFVFIKRVESFTERRNYWLKFAGKEFTAKT